MLIFIIGFVLAIFLGMLNAMIEKNGGKKYLQWANLNVFLGWLVGLSMVAIIVSGCARIESYSNYVNLQKFYKSTVEQYRGAIEMYGDKAVLDVEQAAWVTFQYQGYQENIGTFITDLRNRVVQYNENLVGKQEFRRGWIWWPMVHLPKDTNLRIITLTKGDRAGQEYRLPTSSTTRN